MHMLDRIMEDAGKHWLVAIGEDDEEPSAVIPLRILYMLFALGETILFAAHQQIGPDYDPNAVSMPGLTAMLVQSLEDAPNRTPMQDDALGLFNKIYRGDDDTEPEPPF
jgi:hypothetical protein